MGPPGGADNLSVILVLGMLPKYRRYSAELTSNEVMPVEKRVRETENRKSLGWKFGSA